MKKKNTLILPASIKSHIIPALYLAEILEDDSEIVFATTDEVLANIVKENNFRYIKQSNVRVLLNMEASFLEFHKNKKATFFNIIKSKYRREMFKFRKSELFEIINKEKIDTVIIDVYNSRDYFVLATYPRKLNIFFFNPMLSIYKHNNYPNVSEGFWLPPSDASDNQSNAHKEVNKERWTISKFLDSSLEKNILSQANINLSQIENYPEYTMLFKGVPELILAPQELELSTELRYPWQHYLGLCTRKSRVDTELDEAFYDSWDKIIRYEKKSKIIFCSFGTFYTGNDRPIFDFLVKLITVVNALENVELIISVNNFVIEFLVKVLEIKENVHLFTRVPQLKVLENSDVFITHGGLGSIKESIEYEVPMIVYPIDPNYDQNGNSLKVEYHQIGLRGNLLTDDSQSLKSKIVELITNESFKRNIIDMKKKINVNYSDNKNRQVLKSLNI